MPRPARESCGGTPRRARLRGTPPGRRRRPPPPPRRPRRCPPGAPRAAPRAAPHRPRRRRVSSPRRRLRRPRGPAGRCRARSAALLRPRRRPRPRPAPNHLGPSRESRNQRRASPQPRRVPAIPRANPRRSPPRRAPRRTSPRLSPRWSARSGSEARVSGHALAPRGKFPPQDVGMHFTETRSKNKRADRIPNSDRSPNRGESAVNASRKPRKTLARFGTTDARNDAKPQQKRVDCFFFSRVSSFAF